MTPRIGIAGLVALLLAVGCIALGVKFERDRLTAKHQAETIRLQEAIQAQERAARQKEQALFKQVEDARNEAVKREMQIRTAADAARRTSDGLRDQITQLRRQLPDLAGDALIVRADTLAELFDACQRDYRSLAETADRIASDRQTLIEAWPQ